MEKLAVNVLVAFALCVLAVTLVLLPRALMGSRTRMVHEPATCFALWM
jgi:hypothetical protein